MKPVKTKNLKVLENFKSTFSFDFMLLNNTTDVIEISNPKKYFIVSKK